MNIDKMINMLLIKLSKDYAIFYMERRTYKDNKVSKSYYIKTDKLTENFSSKTELLMYLKEL